MFLWPGNLFPWKHGKVLGVCRSPGPGPWDCLVSPSPSKTSNAFWTVLWKWETMHFLTINPDFWCPDSVCSGYYLIHSPQVSFQNSDKKQNWSLKCENLLLPCAQSLPVSRGIHSKWHCDGVLAGWIQGTWPPTWLDVLLGAWKKESIRMWNKWCLTVVLKGVNSYIFRCKGALYSYEYTYTLEKGPWLKFKHEDSICGCSKQCRLIKITISYWLTLKLSIMKSKKLVVEDPKCWLHPKLLNIIWWPWPCDGRFMSFHELFWG